MISNLFAGEAVEVEQVAQVTYTDGRPVVEFADPITVDGVLVSRETTENLESVRPFGALETVSLAFPRSCLLDLRGARVTIDGRVFFVSGTPQHETSPLSRFDLVVEAERADG